MTTKIYFFFIVACLLFYADSDAAVFMVTSNADNGNGTLREAIQKSALNGTSVPDTIFFNLPDVTRSGRTILLDSSLPNLSSNLIIDGTSQPGVAFGISNAKVQIQNNPTVQYFKCFLAMNVTNIEIYGLYMKGIGGSVGLDFRQAHNLRVGSPGKGNMVTGFLVAFNANAYYPSDSSNNIIFQSNLLGVDESGDTATFNTYNDHNFYLRQVKNLTIGGLGVNEGNLMCDGNIEMEIVYYWQDAFGYLRIQGNKIGTDRTGLKRLVKNTNSGLYIDGVNDGDANPTGTTDVNIEFSNNITAERIELFKIKNYFKFQGNSFGAGADKITTIGNAYAYWISLDFCGKGIIGGPNNTDKNYIAYGAGAGIFQFYTGSITISKNSFFCNTADGIADFTWFVYSRPKSFVTIKSQDSGQVSGTALPNATIELFYDDDCPGCEGKTFISSVTADGNGNWIYLGSNSGGIVVTATDTFGGTSTFSSASLNSDSVIVTNATCGNANGSIKKLRVISGTSWHWEDDQGKIIGYNIDLVNIPPGRYKLVASVGGNACKTESVFYQVNNINRPSIDTTLISITNPSCGLYNGSLKNNTNFNPSYQYEWLNTADAILSGDYSLANPFPNLGAGAYFLKIYLKQDSGCFIRYGPFNLVNQSGPSLATDSVLIGNSTCQKNNGFIRNIKFQNAIGNIYIAWIDSIGKIVSNTIDLTGVAAGKYRLKCKDGSSCDTIVTPYFTIKDTGTILYDTSYMIVKQSSCSGSDGSINGITASNATVFTWIDLSGNVIGNNINISGLPPGVYQLRLNNNYGCEVKTNNIIVGQYRFLEDSVLTSIISDAHCDINNGSVQITKFSADTTFYSFVWKDSVTNNVVSRNTSVQNLAPGFYFLNATDSNGCSKRILGVFIQQKGKPLFDVHALRIIDDTCNIGDGSVRNLLLKDSSGSYNWVWYSKTQPVGNSPNNLLHFHAGNYYAVVTDKYGCSATSDTFLINNKTEFLPAPVVSDLYIPRYTSANIQIKNPLPGVYELFGSNYTAAAPLDSSVNSVLRTPVINADTTFYIRFRHGDCLSSLSKINIKVFDSTIIYIPSAFTPNGDGINDKLQFIVHRRINQFSVSIYNRFGVRIYSGNDVNGYWDGTFKGQVLSTGIFVYIINAVDFNNKKIQQKGTFVLLK